MQVGDVLRQAELELLFKILQTSEMAIAWTFEEMGRVREEISPPVVIHTEKHEPWQAPSFPVPKALQKIVCEMIDERIKAGILEPCLGPYRNPWFLAKKQNGRYRLINSAIHMNRVTIKDATLPPVADEFSEEFAGLQIASYVDFMSGYDQVTVDEKYRDMSAIMTPRGLLRQTTLLQGATNSVAQFVRIVLKILQDHLPHRALPFIDDIDPCRVKGFLLTAWVSELTFSTGSTMVFDILVETFPPIPVSDASVGAFLASVTTFFVHCSHDFGSFSLATDDSSEGDILAGTSKEMPIVNQKFQCMLLELAELLDAHLFRLSKRSQIPCNLPGLLVVALSQELVWILITVRKLTHLGRPVAQNENRERPREEHDEPDD